MREYERAMTTVMCAVRRSGHGQYLDGARTPASASSASRAPVEIMDSAGDVMSATRAAALPGHARSSRAAPPGVTRGRPRRRAHRRRRRDLVRHGRHHGQGRHRPRRPARRHPRLPGRRQGQLRRHARRHRVPASRSRSSTSPRSAPAAGSIAWVDAGGALRVGPRSAGADPGPACYGRGGTEPTVTDADLAARLPRPRPGSPAASRSRSGARARTALDARVADPLGIDVVDAARAVHDIVNANMAAAIRVVTVQRGIDPRDFTLVGFGGAGPMHVVRLADDVRDRARWSCRAPPASRRRSASCGADLGAEERQPFPSDLDALDVAALDAAFPRRSSDGPATRSVRAAARSRVHRAVAMRVRGQAHALEVPLPDGPLAAAVASLPHVFSDHYVATYGVGPAARLQLTTLRCPRRPPHRRTGVSRARRRSPRPHAGAGGVTRRVLRRAPRLRDHPGLRLVPARTGRPSRRAGHRPGRRHDGGGAARTRRDPRPRPQPGPPRMNAEPLAADTEFVSARRAEIVAIAGDLFATHGYANTTVREIADAAGILSGSLYHHFDSKESMVEALLRDFLERIGRQYAAVVSCGTDPLATLRALVHVAFGALGDRSGRGRGDAQRVQRARAAAAVRVPERRGGGNRALVGRRAGRGHARGRCP